MRLTREEAKAQTRASLLEAADRAFVRDGFSGASLDEIADAAGVTTGAVYSSFSGKADLFLHVFDRRLETRIAEVERLGAPEAGGFGGEVASQWFERLDRERAWHLAALEFRLHAARDPELRRRFAKSQRRFLGGVASAYAMANPVEDEAELEVIARAMIALGNGYALERLIDPERISDEELARVAGAILAGLSS